MTISDIEKEVIVLKAIMELIDSIVNFEALMLSDTDPTEARFKTMMHAQLFNIILVDLLSKTDEQGPFESEPYLRILKRITENPHFNQDDAVASLRDSTAQFISWLETEIVVEQVWLPSISLETDLKLARRELVKLAGNIGRHNVLRSVGIAKEVMKALAKSDVNIDIKKSLLTLSELYGRLHSDVFIYHSSTIAEYLNNIRWDIYNYLQPEFNRSIVGENTDPPKYKFNYPHGITSDFAKECYWGLMNEVRRPPYMRRFTIAEWLKKRY